MILDLRGPPELRDTELGKEKERQFDLIPHHNNGPVCLPLRPRMEI